MLQGSRTQQRCKRTTRSGACVAAFCLRTCKHVQQRSAPLCTLHAHQDSSSCKHSWMRHSQARSSCALHSGHRYWCTAACFRFLPAHCECVASFSRSCPRLLCTRNWDSLSTADMSGGCSVALARAGNRIVISCKADTATCAPPVASALATSRCVYDIRAEHYARLQSRWQAARDTEQTSAEDAERLHMDMWRLLHRYHAFFGPSGVQSRTTATLLMLRLHAGKCHDAEFRRKHDRSPALISR